VADPLPVRCKQLDEGLAVRHPFSLLSVPALGVTLPGRRRLGDPGSRGTATASGGRTPWPEAWAGDRSRHVAGMAGRRPRCRCRQACQK
jgi:hypothetical protein